MDEVALEFDAKVRTTHVNGCCPKKCSDRYTLDELLSFNNTSRELDYNVEGSNMLDLAILGQIKGMCRTIDEVKTGRGTVRKQRERLRVCYTLGGVSVCETLFLLTNAISIKRFKRLLKHYKEYGMTPPIHKNYKRTPKKTCSKETLEKVIMFIRNYAEESALFMPGRLANHRVIVKLLPSSDTKVLLYQKYKESCVIANELFVGKSLFKATWNRFCQDVVIMRPRTDLCYFRQKNITTHTKLNGATEEEKQAFFLKCQEHLNTVNTERASYKSVIKQTVDDFIAHEVLLDENMCVIPNTYDGSIHYSFDFAQQIHIPHDSQQPGPIYFLTPYKIGVFGIMNDTMKTQHNFLIPEAVQVTKGSNAIVSYLHYYLQHHSQGEKQIYMHADNCVGQNKNNIVVGYLAWRIIQNLNESITLSFLPVGHTKFGCDWAFGLFKKKFRLSKASCLQQVEKIVEDSTNIGLNRPIRTGSESGEVIVPIYDWLSFFKQNNWKAVKDITKVSHFEFKSVVEGVSEKGVVYTKTALGATETRTVLTLNVEPTEDFPTVVAPEGLSYNRKKYLFNKIREYCEDEWKDTLCPDPGPPPDEEQIETPDEMQVDEPTDLQPPPKTPKRKRKRN